MKFIAVHAFGSNGPPTFAAIPLYIATDKIVSWVAIEFYGQSGTRFTMQGGTELLATEHHSEILPLVLAPD